MKENAKSFKDAMADVRKTLKTLEEANQGLQSEIETLKQQLDDLPFQRLAAEERQELFRDFVNSIFTRDQSTIEKIWIDRSRLPAPPPFVQIENRPKKDGISTRFISFINFKGGVGKTTLVANVASALASGLYQTGDQAKGGGLRVLMVDVDFQGTLSDRCANQLELQNAIQKGYVSTLLLAKPTDLSRQLAELALPVVGCPNASLIAATDSLDLKDSELFIKIALRLYDTRYYFRYWFHQPEILNSYDLVIFDCPPRRTAAAMCALAVSDYIFVPTSPDLFDQTSVSRIITWAQKFFTAIESPCKLGGVILNRTNNVNSLTAAERNYATRLNDYISHNKSLSTILGVAPPYVLSNHAPKRVDINGSPGDPLPGGTIKGNFTFLHNLASEIYGRIYQ